MTLILKFLLAAALGVASLSTHAQSPEAIMAARKIYEEFSLHSRFVFICDTNITYFPSYKDFLYYLSYGDSLLWKDTLRLKEIVTKGTRHPFSPDLIEDSICSYIISEENFRYFRPQVFLTDRELKAINEFNTLDSLVYSKPYDSAFSTPIREKQIRLSESKDFKSYLNKMGVSSKTLLFLLPEIRYKNYSLVAVMYKMFRHWYLKFKLVPLNDAGS